MSASGIIEAEVFRSEQVSRLARTSDPSSPSKGDAWIRTDVQPVTDSVAALRVQGDSGYLEAPLFDPSVSPGQDVYVGQRFVFDDGSEAHLLVTDQGGAVGSPRVVTSSGTEFQAHDATEVNVIPDSGIARYEFEQDVTDSFNDNDGTDNTSAGFTSTAAVGSFAKSFDGDDYVTIPDLTGGLSAATATAYIKATDGSSVGNDRRVFGGTSNAFRLIHRGGGWEFLINSNGISQGSNTFSTGVFVFIAIVYDSAGLGDGSTAKIYKGDASEIASGNPTTATINTESKSIGAKTDGSDGWVGDIDDPRFYNKALSASEVSSLFNSGSI